MTSHKGFFDLKTPRDLLRKMEHDFARMQAAPLDSYPAFDFFVTVEHMLDWVYANDTKRQTAERNANVALQVCSHLANGAKHFQATATRHKSVQGVHERPAMRWGEAVWGESRWGTEEGLEITLSDEEAGRLGRQGWIDALDLAQRLLDYWRTHPGVR